MVRTAGSNPRQERRLRRTAGPEEGRPYKLSQNAGGGSGGWWCRGESPPSPESSPGAPLTTIDKRALPQGQDPGVGTGVTANCRPPDHGSGKEEGWDGGPKINPLSGARQARTSPIANRTRSGHTEGEATFPANLPPRSKAGTSESEAARRTLIRLHSRITGARAEAPMPRGRDRREAVGSDGAC